MFVALAVRTRSKLLLAACVGVASCAMVLGWFHHAVTKPQIWSEDVGGGWRLEHRRYLMSHGTNAGVLYRVVDGRREDADRLVYEARFFPEADCVVYGSTSEGVQILAICAGRRALVSRAGEGWRITSQGVTGPGGASMTPAHIRQLAGAPE